jgi:peptidylprolyl isomerase
MDKRVLVAATALLAGIGLYALKPDGLSANAESPIKQLNASRQAEADASAANLGMHESMSGLKWRDDVVGTGDAAGPGKKVSVHYTGRFVDSGDVFDSSVERGEPFEFQMAAKPAQVIKGWDEGLVGMKVGGKRTLVIPPSLGYGMQDYGPIPGGSTLKFDVELMGVK